VTTQLPERVVSAGWDSSCNGNQQLSERHRTLLRQLNWPSNAKGGLPATLGLTSCYRGEGVSTLAAQLALEAATFDGRRVLLVDANLADPSAHRTFEIEPAPGLADCLLSGEQPAACWKTCGEDGLAVLPAGNATGRQVEVYHRDALAELVVSLKASFDLVVFDLPAAGDAWSVVRLASLLDGVVLVVEAQRVRGQVARRITEQLGRANVRLLGAVLNKHT